jgi:hypothetical protein
LLVLKDIEPHNWFKKILGPVTGNKMLEVVGKLLECNGIVEGCVKLQRIF